MPSATAPNLLTPAELESSLLWFIRKYRQLSQSNSQKVGKAKCCNTSKERRGLVQSENPGDIPY